MLILQNQIHCSSLLWHCFAQTYLQYHNHTIEVLHWRGIIPAVLSLINYGYIRPNSQKSNENGSPVRMNCALSQCFFCCRLKNHSQLQLDLPSCAGYAGEYEQRKPHKQPAFTHLICTSNASESLRCYCVFEHTRREGSIRFK